MISKIKEIYKYRQMLESLVLTDLRTRYKGSFLGFFWTFLNPVLMLIVYSIVFKFVMKINLENYTSFLFIGLITWNILGQSILSGSSVVIRNAGLVKKIYFPKEILPFSVVLGGGINFLLSLPILFPILWINNIQLGLPLLYLPLILLIYLIFTLSLTMIVSCLNVYFRDLEHMLTILVMAWFYITPIVYTSGMIPKELNELFAFNPMNTIVQSFHDVFFYNEYPSFRPLIFVALISVFLLYFSFHLFAKLSRNFAEEI